MNDDKKVMVLHYDGGNTPDITIYHNWAHAQDALGLDDEEMGQLIDGNYSNGDDYWSISDPKDLVYDARVGVDPDKFPEKTFPSEDDDLEDEEDE